MAFDKIKLKNPVTKEVIESSVGFSWTVLFFGWIVAAFRKDWKWMAIMLLITLFLGLVMSGSPAAIVNLVMAFLYNKIFIEEKISDGWIVTGSVKGLAESKYPNLFKKVKA